MVAPQHLLVLWALVALVRVRALEPPTEKRDAALPPCGACTNLVARYYIVLSVLSICTSILYFYSLFILSTSMKSTTEEGGQLTDSVSSRTKSKQVGLSPISSRPSGA